MGIDDFLRKTIIQAVKDRLGIEIEQGSFKVEVPPEKQPGQYGTNAGFVLAKQAGKNPFEIAGEIAAALKDNEYIKDVQAIKPGYTNWSMSNDFYKRELHRLCEEKDYFNNDSGKGIKVNIEFVSANPVGPLNVVSGRAGAYGDALSNIYEASGYEVTRENYVNDHGRQMKLFAQSLRERYYELHKIKKAEIPEDGYMGDYVADIAKQVDVDRENALEEIKAAREMKQEHDVNDYFRVYGREYVKNWQATTLKNFGVEFDTWFSEEDLYKPGAGGKNDVERAVEKIRSAGHLYEKEGAEWFETTKFGDDKDRVVKKSDGEYTYFASDMAYIENKMNRGAEILINILGPDHHGYVKRLEAIVQALGYPADRITVIILQQVNMIDKGKKKKMSKRKGDIILLDGLLSDVGADAARYYFLMRNYNSHLDFDIELAKEQSDKNPVYYVQYAHARVCNIFEHAKGKVRFIEDYGLDEIDFSDLLEEEIILIKAILAVPGVIKEATVKQSPSLLVQSIYDLVSVFHSFYNKCRVVTDDKRLTLRRLYIMRALKTTLRRCFKIIGISAPERM